MFYCPWGSPQYIGLIDTRNVTESALFNKEKDSKHAKQYI